MGDLSHRSAPEHLSVNTCAVVQSFPVLLQISLLLFGIALSANIWSEQPSVAWVIIATTVFGFLFYSLTVMACLISPSCPFQTPISTVLRMLHIDRLLHLIFEPAFRYLTQLASSAHGPVCATGVFAQRSHRLVSAALHKGLRHLVPHSSTKVVDSEAQFFGQGLHDLAEKECTLTLDLPDISTSDLKAPSIKWLLETSMDPEVFLAAANLVPQVEWPLSLDVSDMLHQLSDIFTSCVNIQRQIVPSLEEKASACTMALSHLYYGHVLQAYPGCGEFIGDAELFSRRRTDYLMFLQMSLSGTRTADDVVLETTWNLCVSEDDHMWFPFWLEGCPSSVLEWLSHVLPYHFVIGRVNESAEKLTITVISKLLCSPSSPSTQIVANCTFLACIMVGVQVDKKDIVQIDKSPSFDTMRNLDICRKIYSRVKSSEQDDPRDLLNALRNAVHFMFTVADVSRDPAEVWDGQFYCNGDSHSPEDFDWLVDYLDYIDSDDHEAAYDILLLLGSVGVSCSPAKQHMFVERLIACMDSNMPDHLHYAALRAAHSAREEMASIDATDDTRLRDMNLTKLSPGILSVLCPRPSPTPVNDIPGYIFDSYERNLCYLELVCALARNSNWHPHLYGDHHIDRCISMIPEYCYPKSPTHHAFYLAGILLQIAPQQTSITSLDSVTEQQWWDVMRSAWNHPAYDIYNTRCFKLLPVLVDDTKKYMRIASKSDLEQLIRDVDRILEEIRQKMQEMRLEMEPDMPGLEEGEAITVAMKELRTVASNMLERLLESDRRRDRAVHVRKREVSRPERNRY
ncbi:hypothetical protein EDB19DRAFT_1954368 [Suillus lakei]|nr:hypothetical protein EDB19DRAFT_1954368 [Suillus lakei]